MAALRPAALKELLLNGFSFISERLSRHAPAHDDTPPPPNDSLTVDRIKATPSFAAPYSHTSPHLSHDYELVWRDDPRDYISPAGFEAVASLLQAWKDDLSVGNVTRCPYPDPIVRRFDDQGSHAETRLSAVAHNYMLERHGQNTEEAWQDAVVELLRAIEATEQWISMFYTHETFDIIKSEGVVPYDELSASTQQFWDVRCGLCANGDFLAFAILQTHQWGHPGMQLAQLALMKLLVDLEAFHRQQLILSFVSVERQSRPPGHLYSDKDGVLEAVTAEQLRGLWLGGESRPRTGGSERMGIRRLPSSTCRIYGEGAGGPGLHDALRRSRIMSAAAASLKAARRTSSGTGPLVIPPSQSLLFERYRRTPDAGASRIGRDSLPAFKAYKIPAKRKAVATTPAPRQAKRGRPTSDWRKADSEAAAAAAAAIPLPPSPAATEETTSEEDIDIDQAAALVETAQQRRLPWTDIFPDTDEDEDDSFGTGARRLRISTAKAEELRLIAEHKRATQEAARLKREAERRRKEEERRRKEEEELARSSGLRPPTRNVIGSLSDSWHSRVIAAVRADPAKDVAKSPEGTALKCKDFRTVVSKSEWLNDEIVNGFLLHLANYINAKAGITNIKTQTPKCHAFTSFFWKPLSTKGAAGTERWMKRVGVTRDNFLNIDTILIPICEQSHWTLVVVRPKRTTVSHMNSLGHHGAGSARVTGAVLRWVKEVLKDKYVDTWRVQHYDSPQQTNGWDCGVHTVTNALFVSLGLDPSYYGAVDMSLQRDRIAATLINGGFSGDLDLGGL